MLRQSSSQETWSLLRSENTARCIPRQLANRGLNLRNCDRPNYGFASLQMMSAQSSRTRTMRQPKQSAPRDSCGMIGNLSKFIRRSVAPAIPRPLRFSPYLPGVFIFPQRNERREP